ncbi:MAG: hypothetical protein U0U66_04525 [Cytophagaceae bacterium]
MNTVTEKLIERFEDETGIPLTTKELSVSIEEDALIINIWGQEMIALDAEGLEDLDSDDTAEEIWDSISDEFYDVREQLIELKLAALNTKYISDLQTQVLTALQQTKMKAKMLDALDFEFMDVSDADKDFGYPKVALRVTDFEQLECFIPIDVKQNPLQLDAKKVVDEVQKKL